MLPISTWTATSQERLLKGKTIKEISLTNLKLKVIVSDFCLWILCEMPMEGRVAFRVAFAANDYLDVKNVSESGNEIKFILKGSSQECTVKLFILDDEKGIFRFTTTIKPEYDMLIPYWPRDIMPLFDDGKTQNTKGKIHASQVGNRSGILFFSVEKPNAGSVFYFQNLTSLNEYCEATETAAGDLVGGEWPEIGMKLPITNIDKPLKHGKEYILSDAFILINDKIPNDNFQVSKQFLNHLASIYNFLPKPETIYQDWPEMLHKSLNGIENHKGCWQFSGGHAYLNAYVGDYDTPPEIMVQLAVLLPLLDYDEWSGEKHTEVIKILQEGLPKFYDSKLETIVRWLPSLEKKLDWSEEQKKPDVMDSWYLHHPMLNLSRLAKQGNETAKKLLFDSIDFVIKVAHEFNYEWPVFYKMSTLEILKKETEKGKGGEKDVPGIYALLMLQMWELSGDGKYLKEAVTAAKKLDGLGFDIFYQANNTVFTAGALLRLYKETREEIFLDLSYVCIAALMKNVQLWESRYGNAGNYPTFFGIFPLKDAPYTAAYEEQEVFAGIHSYLKEAEDLPIIPSVKMLLAELTKYVINRVGYYFPPMLPTEMLADRDDVKTGEIDYNLWIAVEDLQDGWNKSGQVGQEVYGAGIAFGIVPRQYHKIKGTDLMIFTEYPCVNFRKRKNTISFEARGSSELSFRLAVISSKEKLPKFEIICNKQQLTPEQKQPSKSAATFIANGDSKITIQWED